MSKVSHNKSRFRFKMWKGRSETQWFGPRLVKARQKGPQLSSVLLRKTQVIFKYSRVRVVRVQKP